MRDSILSCPQAQCAGDSQRTCTFGSVWYRNMAAFNDFALLRCPDTGQFLAQLGSSFDSPFCRGLILGSDGGGLTV